MYSKDQIKDMTYLVIIGERMSGQMKNTAYDSNSVAQYGVDGQCQELKDRQ
ncbi:hypothetical protein JGZ12_09130 [Staphylococcus pseudintermedius]|uniref:hypothetical protein n=1 Tax=Staphylococcus pseudintermedius TaxID=283734 RepID=UPI0018F764AD|nr:hypothetical protein [Staphylococcus pseudintermedius]MBJ8232870.1 hypothetical protein [Staphylococcus pseudintermedius]